MNFYIKLFLGLMYSPILVRWILSLFYHTIFLVHWNGLAYKKEWILQFTPKNPNRIGSSSGKSEAALLNFSNFDFRFEFEKTRNKNLKLEFEIWERATNVHQWNIRLPITNEASAISNGIFKTGNLIFLVKRVPGRGPEQRESEKTVLFL